MKIGASASDEIGRHEEVLTPAYAVAFQVVEERVADDNIIMIKGCASTRAVTLLLRGANDYMLDEMDRSIHDSLCAVKRVMESGLVVPGGGAVESALSVYLENFATTLGSREQLAIGEFANAALVIPKTLAVNAAKDATVGDMGIDTCCIVNHHVVCGCMQQQAHIGGLCWHMPLCIYILLASCAILCRNLFAYEHNTCSERVWID